MYGIYGIFNATKERWYVGQSQNVSDRLSEHRSRLKRGTHHCKEMQRDYDNGDVFFVFAYRDRGNIPKRAYKQQRKRIYQEAEHKRQSAGI